MNNDKAKYYDRLTQLILSAFEKICEDKSFIRGSKLSDRKRRIIVKEYGESFCKDGILFSDKFIFLAPSLVVTPNAMYSYLFDEKMLKNNTLFFNDIKEIRYKVIPLCLTIEIVRHNGTTSTIYNYIPYASSYSDVKAYEKEVKSGRYKDRTLCYVICIYALTALSKCSVVDCDRKILEIENNIKGLIECFFNKSDTTMLYGNLMSFDFVKCCYDPQIVERNLRKIAEIKGEVYNLRKEELIGNLHNAINRSVERYERDRQRVIKKVEEQVNLAEKRGPDSQKIQVAKERITIAKGFSQSDASCNELSETKKDLRSMYISSPKVPAQIGATRVAFVFSCPGQKEQLANQVCYGATGESLQHLITYCHTMRPDVFASPLKSDYTITNASDRVHYAALTHDTEASYEEIGLSENLDRLRHDLTGVDLVICMGDRASYAVYNAGVSANIVKGEHLSAMHLNRVYNSAAATSSERRVDRITQVADKILAQI